MNKMFNKKIDVMQTSQSSLSTESDNDPDESTSYFCGLFKPSYPCSGGVKHIGPMTYTYGNKTQASFSGPYGGLQCTTMALTSVIHSLLRPHWTPERINAVLLEGNRLHTYLREKVRLSTNNDGKIAIEDIPYRYYIYLGHVFGQPTSVRLRQELSNVFTSPVEGFECFLTIREYLLKWRPVYNQRSGFLLTLGEYSYAVILNKNGTVKLFDSHGHLKHNGKIIKEKAGVLRFPSVKALQDFFITMYGTGTHAVIAAVAVSFESRVVPVKKPGKKIKAKQEPYIPYIPATKASLQRLVYSNIKHTESFDDPSPFIGMMGGG